jgi:hypothetical protein
LKALDEISARATSSAAARASLPPSPAPARRFGLTGPSVTLNPEFDAYRVDVADVALAGKVVASHFAEACIYKANAPTPLLVHAGAAPNGEVLDAGDLFSVLDCSRGFAWGYRQSDHRVGYVDLDALSRA